MAGKGDLLQKAVSLSTALEKRGFQPVLVGGIALVILGSQRVTKDFDFLISRQDVSADDLTEILYAHGLELVTKFNDKGEVLRTVDNERVAAIKLKSDLPDSLFFFDWETKLKVDFLLDFPIPAQEIAARATRITIKSHSLRVASPEDLLRLKKIAHAARSLAKDAQDIEFLRRLKK